MEEDVAPLRELRVDDRKLVMEVCDNAHVLQRIHIGRGCPVLFAPMMWDVNPDVVKRVFEEEDRSHIMEVVKRCAISAGVEIAELGLAAEDAKRANRAIKLGLLPTIPVDSAGGVKEFTFSPQNGLLIGDPAEKEILSRARALVACVRYGQKHAKASKILSPGLLLNAMRNQSRAYSIGEHSEVKEQYAQLVTHGIGRIFRGQGNRYSFQLIPSKENLRAVGIAIELVTHGEVLQERSRIGVGEGAALCAPGRIGTEFEGIRAVADRRQATDDELEELVEKVRRT